jgi:hypothetical protein
MKIEQYFDCTQREIVVDRAYKEVTMTAKELLEQLICRPCPDCGGTNTYGIERFEEGCEYIEWTCEDCYTVFEEPSFIAPGDGSPSDDRDSTQIT